MHAIGMTCFAVLRNVVERHKRFWTFKRQGHREEEAVFILLPKIYSKDVDAQHSGVC